MTDFKAKFILNFIEDNRWLYITEGLGTTFIVTIFAILLGTALGFLVAVIRSTADKNDKNPGVKVMQQINEEKAKLLYDFIDNSNLYKNYVNKEDRSLMNVPFVTGDTELDAKFVAEASKAGLVSLKGHRLVGGMRASIYNAMPIEGVKALIDFMKKFELENK